MGGWLEAAWEKPPMTVLVTPANTVRNRVRARMRLTLPAATVQTHAHDDLRARGAGGNVSLDRSVTVVTRFDERGGDVSGRFGVVLVQRSVVAGFRLPTAYDKSVRFDRTSTRSLP